MKVFIAHSFAKRDSELIRSFKEFIAPQVTHIETGEPAELKPISEKVIQRIKDSDLLVAVFSCEKPLYESAMNRILGNPSSYTFSSWVLHELSYAIALGKRFMILIEDEIKEFPNFHGDSEYVRFKRKNAEKSFQKILEMISSLKKESSKPSSISDSGTPEIPQTETKPDLENETKSDEDGRIPLDILSEIFDANSNSDVKKMNEILETKIKPKAKESDYVFWKSVVLRFSHALGVTSAFDELKSLSTQYPKDTEILRQIAIRYGELGAYDLEREQYEQISKLTDVTTEDGRKDLVGSHEDIADCLMKQGKKVEALNLLWEDFNNPIYKSFRAQTLRKLALLAKEAGNNVLFEILAEGALAIDPTNTSLRFKLAYSYAENGSEKLALLHYKILTDSSKHVSGLNNLGVQYDRLEMPIKSVESYQQAADNQETLAMANLAQKYLDKGFKTEADELIKNAHEIAAKGEKISENVGIAQQRVSKELDAEDKKEKEILSEAEKQRAYFAEFAMACMTNSEINGSTIVGQWTTPLGVIEINAKNNLLNFKTETQNPDPFDDGSNYQNVTRITEIDGTLLAKRVAKFGLKIKDFFKFEPHLKDKNFEKFDGTIFAFEKEDVLHVMRLTNSEQIFEEWTRSKT